MGLVDVTLRTTWPSASPWRLAVPQSPARQHPAGEAPLSAENADTPPGVALTAGERVA